MDITRALAQIEAHEEWMRQRPMAVRVLDALTGLRNSGWSHIRAWEVTANAFGSKDDNPLMSLAARYFVTSAVAHLDAATLCAAKLYERRNDSINADYRIQLLRREADASFPDRSDAILRAASLLSGTMEEHRETLEAIKARRDRRIAHMDRRSLSTGLDEESVIDAGSLRILLLGTASALHAVHSAFPGQQMTDSPSGPDRQMTEWFGAEDLSDLLHFARAAYCGDLAPCRSELVEKTRQLARYMRELSREHGSGDPDV